MKNRIKKRPTLLRKFINKYGEIYIITALLIGLLLMLSSCAGTCKVKTELVDLGEVHIKNDFEKLELEPVKFERGKDKICLNRENAVNLAENTKRTNNYITYLKEIYNNDINTCESILNRKYE